jgi:hypothetical protein
MKQVAPPPLPLPALGAMLDGYFHQDYRYIYVTPVGAARAYAVEAAPEDLLAAREELALFIAWAESAPRKSWQLAFASLGGAWLPSTLEPMRTVLRALEAAKPA